MPASATAISVISVFVLLCFQPAAALIDPEKSSLTQKTYVSPKLKGPTEFLALSELLNSPAYNGNSDTEVLEAFTALTSLQSVVNAEETKIDVRSGRITKIDLNVPLFPGNNNLLWTVSTSQLPSDKSHGSAFHSAGIRAFQDGTSFEEDKPQHDIPTAELREHYAHLAISGIKNYLDVEMASSLSINVDELFVEQVRFAVHGSSLNGAAGTEGGALIQLSIPRTYQGISMPEARAFATVKNGNLIHFGLSKWGDVRSAEGGVLNVEPVISIQEAKAKLEQWAGVSLLNKDSGAFEISDASGRERSRRSLKEELSTEQDRIYESLGMDMFDTCEPQLQILTLDDNDESKSSANKRGNRNLKGNAMTHKRYKQYTMQTNKGTAEHEITFTIGSGYKHALVWRICPTFTNQTQEIMEGLVDAHSGEIYSFVDKVDYFSGVGSVYPVSNDGKLPDGILAEYFPMPFMYVTHDEDGEVVTSDTGGNYWGIGNQTATFKGKYVNMEDACGEALIEFEGDFDWGGTNGTDCNTPGFGGPGNTQASRSGYYELNRMIEIARGHLPGNQWLSERLTANMNIDETCNAFWNGQTVNFYRSSAQCANTGEIAGVFDHEWGHGLDSNDVALGIVKPSGEGIADIYTALRLGNSCIGRGFYNKLCSQFGDPCINDCTGVRDIDFANHRSEKPHDFSWTKATCVNSRDNVHCKGLVYSEAIWSLWKRDLPAFYGYDDNTALEIVVRLTYIAAGNIATWYSGSPPYGGCGGDSGYMSYLLADDDDGNVTNGTPHMQAIFSAHNRQQIACDIPVQDSGCAGKPKEAPNVTVVPGSMENIVTWTAVNNASKYQVFRTEGVNKCLQGKVLLETLPSNVLNFTDSGLMNGRVYYYLVIPKGSDDACFGPASECIESSPLEGPDYQYSCRSELVVLNIGQQPISAIHECTLFAIMGFTGTLALSCDASAMTGVACTAPSTVIFLPGDKYKSVQIIVNGTDSAQLGDGKILTTATSEITSRRAEILAVVVAPSQDQIALYDPVLHAPNCFLSSVKCSSGDLIDGRGSSEVNSPNTLDDCYDGDWGRYHVHPSVDRIYVRSGTKDNKNSTIELTERTSATIVATIWSTWKNDLYADFYYTKNIEDPDWIFIATRETSVSGESQLIGLDYELPVGLKQAARVNLRYKGSRGTCPSGSYHNYGDVDDLVFTVKESDFYIECPDSIVMINKDDAPMSVAKNCTLVTLSSFVGTVSFSCNALALAGVSCTAPPDINIQSPVQMIIGYIINASASIVEGEEEIIVVNVHSGDVVVKQSFRLIIVSSRGSQMAVYNEELGAPHCADQGSKCYSGGLLFGRGGVGPETNAPNTIDGCADGNDGDYHIDEQLDAITVRSGRIDGTGGNNTITEGEYAVISVEVFAFSSKDRADFFYTGDAFHPSWIYIGSINSTKKAATETLEMEYVLPWGPIQAVHVKYDYEGSISTCQETGYGDADDLVFAVAHTPFSIKCLNEGVIFDKDSTPSSEDILCMIFTSPDFEGIISINCSVLALNGVSCTTDSTINIPLGALETNVTITLNASSFVNACENGDVMVLASYAGNFTKTALIPVLIAKGGGRQIAEYDKQLGAPMCNDSCTECSSGNLLDGRGEVEDGPELNEPNTIDECTDGSWGQYHLHPSIDKLTVRSKNAYAAISENDTAIISATVWSTFADGSLFADFYYTGTPDDPSWEYIGTLTTTLKGKPEVLEIEYDLPQGTVQAVRVHFRYNDSISPCPGGPYRNYGDADDLVFVAKASPLTPTAAPSTSSPTTSTTTSPTAEDKIPDAKWFMNWSVMKCYQDCMGDYPCGGPKEFWNDAYPTLNDCCITNLGTSSPTITDTCLDGGP